jgi:hypothetical protein
MRFLTISLLMSAAMCQASACINDSEIRSAEDDYRRDYPEHFAEPTPEEVPVVAIAGVAGVGGIGIALLVAGLFMRRRDRP